MTEDTSHSLVNLGGLTKPADTLVKKISKAVGAYFAPYQIKRVAKAEAEAAIIHAKAELEITDLHRRAIHRFVDEEAQRQKNMEYIAAKSFKQLHESASPDQMDDDWITNFFDKCRLISDDQMQQLWSRVLAGEANAPGTFSKRTVNILGDVDKADAELFTKLCGFGWAVGTVVPLVFKVEEDIYSNNGLHFDSLIHLEAIGMIQFNLITNYERLKLPKSFDALYYGRRLRLRMPRDSDNRLIIGKVLLTRTGQELAPICGSKPVDGFWEYVQKRWEEYLPKGAQEQGSELKDADSLTAIESEQRSDT